MYLWYALFPFPWDRQSLCGHWESWVAGPKHPGHSSKPLSITTTLNPPPFLTLVPIFFPQRSKLAKSWPLSGILCQESGSIWEQIPDFYSREAQDHPQKLWAVLCPVLGWVAVPAHAQVSTQPLPCWVNWADNFWAPELPLWLLGRSSYSELPWNFWVCCAFHIL